MKVDLWKLLRLFSLLGLVNVGLDAQTVSLFGNISDPSGKIITGAVVKLQQNGLSSISNAHGNYILASTKVGKSDHGRRELLR